MRFLSGGAFGLLLKTNKQRELNSPDITQVTLREQN